VSGVRQALCPPDLVEPPLKKEMPGHFVRPEDIRRHPPVFYREKKQEVLIPASGFFVED
jgi:hypothetical protein